MTQRPLPPVARATDPGTSHTSGEIETRSGNRQRIMARILAVLRAEPGLTSGEISDRIPDLEYQQVWKRCSDLKNAHLIYAQGTRVWPHTGRQQDVLWPMPVEPEQRALL